MAKKTGRPTSFTQEIGEKICQGVASGASLRQVLLEPDMPCRSVVYGWADQFPEFKDALARAREDCADWHADQAIAVACAAKTKDEAAAARVQTATHLALAKVHDPRRYGDQSRFQVEHSGSVQGIGMNAVRISISPATPLATVPATALDVTPNKPALPSGKE